MSVRPLVLPLGLATALALTACGSSASTGATGSGTAPATVEITHAQGRTSVPVKPAKVAVFDFGVLDTVDALGGHVVALPKQALPKTLDKYKDASYVDAGTMQEPDLEKLAQAKPDVILIGPRTAAKYADLTKIAPTVDLSMKGTDVIADGKAQARSLGTIFDATSTVDQGLTTLDEAVSRTAAKAANAGTGLVLMTSGGKVAAFGPGSRFGLVHDQLKVAPAMNDLKVDRHGQALGFEAIAKAAPKRLFVVDRDAAIGQSGAAAKQVLDNPLVGGTPAWKDGKVTYLDGQRWYVMGSGLRNLPEMVAEVERGLS